MQYQSIAVFCGSKSGNNPNYAIQARQLGNLIAQKNIRLIYGGGNKGLMAAVANGVLELGGQVTGIIPQVLTEWEHQHDGLTELLVVENMHIRKHLLYEKSDAAIILPGGYGTLDELFEILTWNQLNIHNKPIYILNTDGFYDHLLQHIAQMLADSFLYLQPADTFKVISNPDQIF